MKKKITVLVLATLVLIPSTVSAKVYRDVWDWNNTIRWTLYTNSNNTRAYSSVEGYGRQKRAKLELRNDLHQIVHSSWTAFVSAKTLNVTNTSSMSSSYYVYGDYSTKP